MSRPRKVKPTLTPEERKKRNARATTPIYGLVMKLVVPETGEQVKAFVPDGPANKAICNARKYTAGSSVRMLIQKPRNGEFHKLAHAVGTVLHENVPGFEQLKAHAALKKVQQLAGVCCDIMMIDLGMLGVHPVKVPRSIAYDEMEDGEFHELFEGVTSYIDEHYSAGLCDEVRREYHVMTTPPWERMEGEDRGK